MADAFKELSDYAFTNAWVPKQKREYSRTAHRSAKSATALRSKSVAKNSYKGTFKYVADFFRYAGVEELVQVYQKLKRRKGYYIDGSIGINADEHPHIRDTPEAFFKAFDTLERQVENADARTVLGKTAKTRSSARKRLFELVMKYEDIKTYKSNTYE
jgi:hypothetical protein